MGIEWTDSFVGYTNSTISGAYSSPSNPSTPQSGGPNGAKYYPLNGSGTTLPRVLSGSLARVLVGFRHYWGGSTTGAILRLIDNATTQVTLSIDSANRIVVANGAGTTLGTSAPVHTSTRWDYIEVDATIDNTTGSVLVKVNGATALNLTNVDTQNSANASVTTVSWAGTSGDDRLTDVYILNATGAPNSLLGDVTIAPLRPTAAGNYTDWTLGAGGSKTAAVNEATADGDTSYNSSATAGQRDTFATGDLSVSLTGTIAGVAVKCYARKDDGGSRLVGGMVRLAGVDAEAAGASVSSSYAWLYDAFVTDPSAAAWTPANVNAAEFGYKLVS